MRRRSFFKMFLAIPGLTPILGNAMLLPETDPELLYPAQGCKLGENSLFNFCLPAGEYDWPGFKVGLEFHLHRVHDVIQEPNAVALFYDGKYRFDAYVPRPENAAFTRLLDAGIPLKCRIMRKTGAQRDIPGIFFAVYNPETRPNLPGPEAVPVSRGPIAGFRRGMKKEYSVGGFQYHGGEYIWNEIRVGDQLNLSRDTNYPQDPYAVAVYCDSDMMIGYVPRPDNAAIARLLDHNVPLHCRIIEKSESPVYNRGVRISVATAKIIH